MKLLYIISGSLLVASFSFCGDLDDGIGTADGISAGNDLQKDLNVKYIIRKAKAKASNSANGDTVITGDGSMGTNIGGVNMIGGKAGDIYIIQENKGDITTVGN